MTDQAQPSIWERSTLVRFFRWLFSWRGIRRILIVVAWTATIIALFYGEENWRGRRAWNKYRHELEARGEQLDWKAFIPKPVPAEQNFAATSFFEFLFINKTNRHNWNDDYDRASRKIPAPGPGTMAAIGISLTWLPGEWRLTRFDLGGWCHVRDLSRTNLILSRV